MRVNTTITRHKLLPVTIRILLLDRASCCRNKILKLYLKSISPYPGKITGYPDHTRDDLSKFT